MHLSGYLRRMAPEAWCVGVVKGMLLLLLSMVGCCRADLHVLGKGEEGGQRQPNKFGCAATTDSNRALESFLPSSSSRLGLACPCL